MLKPALRALLMSTALALAGAVALAPAAGAVEPGQVGVFPAWSVSGTSGAYTATPTFPASAGFPATTVASTGSTLAAPSGVTAFLGAGTDFGAEFGTSRSQPYLTLSPAVTDSSATTISFDAEPPAGWGFALGDIDADWAYIQAFADTAQTSPLPLTALGFQSTGNYCAATPKPGTCGSAPYTDAPVWVTAPELFDGINYLPGTLRGNSLPGAPAATRDTSGAYGWFQPDASVRSIRILFGIRDGFPTAQLWLAGPAPKVVITGTVTIPDAPAGAAVPDGTMVQIEQPDGQPLLDIEDQPLTVPVDPATGTYTIELPQAEEGYIATVIVPPDFVAPDPVPLPGLPDDPETLVATAPPIVIVPMAVTPPPEPPAPPAPQPPAPAPAPAAGPQLAESGGSVDPVLLGLACTLLAAGLMLVLGTRFRTTR